jgi:hypothetical protein
LTDPLPLCARTGCEKRVKKSDRRFCSLSCASLSTARRRPEGPECARDGCSERVTKPGGRCCSTQCAAQLRQVEWAVDRPPCGRDGCGERVKRRRSRFCSQSCASLTQPATVRLGCARPGCGEKVRRARAKFCSPQCMGMVRLPQERPTKVCEHCKQVFPKRDKLTLKRWDKQRACSEECRKLLPVTHTPTPARHQKPQLVPSADRLVSVEPSVGGGKTKRKEPPSEGLPATPVPAAVPDWLTIDGLDLERLGNPDTPTALLAVWHAELRAWAGIRGLTSRDLHLAGDWPTLDDAAEALGFDGPRMVG